MSARHILSCFALITAIFIFCNVCTADQANVIPWSGYWWPSLYGGLATGSDYRGHPAPLEKYSLLVNNDLEGDLINWYLSWYYDPNALSWEGLCPYWARASMMESYDILPSSENNIVFRVGDKKGLLTLCHDFDKMQTVDGNPVNFHLWLLGYITDQKIPFTADLDAGVEVWYYPIYSYNMSSRTAGSTESVTVTISYADDDVQPDYIGTWVKERVYTYNLTLDSNGDIIDGEWTGNSVSNHPETLSFPLNTATRCPYIDCNQVRQIAQSRDDFLEVPGNKPVSIRPGTYNLILLDEDAYVLNGNPGDEALIEISADDGNQEKMDVQVFNRMGDTVGSWTLGYGQTLSDRLIFTEPPYTVVLTQNDYSIPGIYTLTLDDLKAVHQDVPYIPKNGLWSSFAITNASNQTVKNVMLVTRYNDGRSLQTIFGPQDFSPGENQILLFNNLPWRVQEYADSDSVCLIADQPIQFINLFGYDQKPMAGFVQGHSSGAHLVIPDAYYEAPGRNMFGSVSNETFEEAPVTFKIFSADGAIGTTFTRTIPAGGKMSIQPGTSPFNNIPNGGWIDISATGGNQLSAYQYLTYKTGNKNSVDTLFGLPVGETVKLVPHITPLLGWWETELTIINPSGNVNPIVFHYLAAGNKTDDDKTIDLPPYGKQLINLSSEFGKFEGDPLYRSALEIAGKYPITGYYTYSAPSSGDEANMPLLDENDFKNELVLPHYAGKGGYFWTSVCICNPNDYSITVTMDPYNDSGNMIDGAEYTETLNPGAYDTFTIPAKFGDVSSDIAFIKFTTQEGLLGGFYLYGNTKNGVVSSEMLSGANM
jgi:hypothetical protein